MVMMLYLFIFVRPYAQGRPIDFACGDCFFCFVLVVVCCTIASPDSLEIAQKLRKCPEITKLPTEMSTERKVGTSDTEGSFLLKKWLSWLRKDDRQRNRQLWQTGFAIIHDGTCTIKEDRNDFSVQLRLRIC
ncbi:hypothetical protein POM88_023319 [Heracleum sosnowskyi]|uniref:Secreted protein n=1 Tax=Heracleum sosnowskyi TaxID=360622 RepID=A0AAD8IGT9_9APIA|nr:hypothetical protein POM88_023319 [Heracleum sosnowskyi]